MLTIRKSPSKSPAWVIFFFWTYLNFALSLIKKKMKGKTRITIQGYLDKKWKNSFKGMKISYESGSTILSGNIKDEAHLHGILNIIRDLNIKLISINPLEK